MLENFRNSVKTRGFEIKDNATVRAKKATRPEKVIPRINREIEALRRDNPEGVIVWAPGLKSEEAIETVSEVGLSDQAVLYEPGRMTKAMTRATRTYHGESGSWRLYREIPASVDAIVLDPGQMTQDRNLREAHWSATRFKEQGQQIRIIFKGSPLEAVA